MLPDNSMDRDLIYLLRLMLLMALQHKNLFLSIGLFIIPYLAAFAAAEYCPPPKTGTRPTPPIRSRPVPPSPPAPNPAPAPPATPK